MDKVLRVEKKLFLIFLLISPVVFLFFIQGVQYMLSNGIEGYRDLTYGSSGSPSVIFKSLQLELMYRLIVAPILFIGAFVSIAIFYISGRYRLLLLIVLLGLFDSIMMLGRFYFYHLIFLFVAGFFLKLSIKKIKRNKFNDVNLGRFKKKSSFPLLTVSVLLFVLMSISLVRGGDGKAISDLLGRYVFEYHTVGFTLFDDALSDPESPINHNVMYGSASFSGLIRYPLVVAKQFLDDIDRSMAAHSSYRSAFTDLGADDGRRMYNSYYTILYTFYLDGGWFGVLLGSILLGVFSGCYYKKFIFSGDLKEMVFCLLFLYVVYFSIFSSPIENEKFFGGIIFFILIYHFGWKTPKRLDLKS